MTGRATLAIAASLFLLGSTSAHASENGFYAGLSIGQADHDVDSILELSPDATGVLTFDTSVDSKDTSFGAFGGYDFGRWLAVEAAFNNLGTSSLDSVWAYAEGGDVLEADSHADLEASAFSVAALLTIPIGDSFSIGLRAGGAYAKLEVDVRADFTFNGVADPTERTRNADSEFAPVYGINAEYAVTPRVSVRAEWQRFQDLGDGLESFDGFDVDLLTLSVLGRF